MRPASVQDGVGWVRPQSSLPLMGRRELGADLASPNPLTESRSKKGDSGQQQRKELSMRPYAAPEGDWKRCWE